jgi:hypothetical protein
MAEAYQLPGPFQLPSIPQTSFNVADQRATADVSFNQFTDQIRQYTNINNANREVSLREKQFLRNIVENDRNYELAAEQQNQNIRSDNLTYEINKFSYDKQRENYVQLQEAWGKREDWQNTIDRLAPNGGNSPTYLTDRARAFRLLAKNPADFQVLQAVFDPYDKQYAVFEKTKSIENEAEIQSAFDRGEMDDEFIGETPAPDYYRSILQLQFSDPVGYQAGLRNLKRISAKKQREEESAIKAEQNVRDLGTLNALAQAQGLTGQPSRIAMKDGKVEFEVGSTRVPTTRSAGASGTPKVDTYSKEEMEYITKELGTAEADIANKEAEVLAEASPVAKAGLQADLAGLKARKASLEESKSNVLKLLDLKAKSQIPAGQPAPQGAPAKKATPQGILRPPTMPAPLPAQAPSAVAPLPAVANPFGGDRQFSVQGF